MSTKQPDFEDFLKNKHSANCGLPDDFGDWLDRLDPDELILYGDQYALEYARQELKDFGDNLQIFKSK